MIDKPIEPNKANVMRLLGWLGRESQGLYEVAKSNGFLVLFGLGTGIGLIVLSQEWSWLHASEIRRPIAEHLGLGFVVSAIAVFGYEWRSHMKGIVQLAKDMNTSLEEIRDLNNFVTLSTQLVQSTKRIEQARGALVLGKAQLDIITTRTEDAFDAVLKIYVGEKWSELRKDLKLLIETISHIQRQPGWVGDQYLRVVQWLLRETVLDNTRSFEMLNDPQHALGDSPFKVPKSGEMADQILAAQMAMMTSADNYDVISDIGSWRDYRMEAFRDESTGKIRKNVVVRRIFNMFRPDLPRPTHISYQERVAATVQMIEEHRRFALNHPGYQVRVFWEKELNQLLEREKGERERKLLEERVNNAHFGLFKQGAPPKTVVRFLVKDPDLSNLELCSRPRFIQEDVKLFESMWRVARRLGPGEIRNEIEDIDKELMNRAIREIMSGEIERFTRLLERLDPVLTKIFGDHLLRQLTNVAQAVDSQRILLNHLDEFKMYYKMTLTRFPKSEFWATSLPSKVYFWGDPEIEEAITRFMSEGGRMKRIFFLKSPDELNSAEAKEIISKQKAMGIKVYAIGNHIPFLYKLFFVDSEGRFAWRVETDSSSQIVSVNATADRRELADYKKTFEELLSISTPL